jgi:hypothetical protein
MKTTDELRILIDKLDNHLDANCFIAIFSDHSGYVHENMGDRRLGEFNNEEEMMELIEELLKNNGKCYE